MLMFIINMRQVIELIMYQLCSYISDMSSSSIDGRQMIRNDDVDNNCVQCRIIGSAMHLFISGMIYHQTRAPYYDLNPNKRYLLRMGAVG